MSAYVIIEASVLDEDSRDRYAAQAGPIFAGGGRWRKVGVRITTNTLWKAGVRQWYYSSFSE